jgi:hypothetical protein
MRQFKRWTPRCIFDRVNLMVFQRRNRNTRASPTNFLPKGLTSALWTVRQEIIAHWQRFPGQARRNRIVDNCNWYLPTPKHSVSPFSRKPEQGPYTPKWAVFLDSVRGWRRVWTTNGVTDTGFWVKPAATDEPAYEQEAQKQLSPEHQSSSQFHS